MKDYSGSPTGQDVSSYLAVGAQLGSYRIEAALDHGGMAYVYEATDVHLDRHVALKVLAPELAAGSDFRQRFLREARFAASLDHPNIVPIYEAGEAAGLLYIAMRFVRGGNLAALLRRTGPLEPEHALAILSPVADALDTAHAADLIHRDVKPANILLTITLGRNGYEHVYLGDFGLTKHATSGTRITSTGLFMGTMGYISPEQIQGRPVDARTDLYSFGCVAYECLSGVPPFVRPDPAAVLWAHLHEQPAALAGDRPHLRAADAVIARAMAKKPGDRYRTCAQFTAALSEALLADRQPLSNTATAAQVVPGDIGYESQLPPIGHDDQGWDDRQHTGVAARLGVSSTTLSVFLVDDHEMVRRGVADLLDAEVDLAVVGQAASAAEALEAIPGLRPDVAVLDMRLPDGNGVELCRELRSRLPELNCLMLTSFTDEEAMVDAILAGARGYVIKDIRGVDLLSAVRTVGAGSSLLDARATTAVLKRLRIAMHPENRPAELSKPEGAVLEFIGQGLTNRQIGRRMSISDKTVKAYVSHILAKLGVARRAEAAALASWKHDRPPDAAGT